MTGFLFFLEGPAIEARKNESDQRLWGRGGGKFERSKLLVFLAILIGYYYFFHEAAALI